MVERKRLEQLKPEPAQEKSKRGRGRPSKYEPRFAKMAAKHCKLGATDVDLADLFEVSSPTIWFWQSQFPEFRDAVREAKALVFDAKVERSLAQLAMGYSVDIEEVKVAKDGEIIRYNVRKHYPPNVTAGIFWLKNRQPDKWRDVWQIDHSGKVDTSNVTAEQLLDEIRKEAAELGILPEGVANLKAATNGGGNNGKTKH